MLMISSGIEGFYTVVVNKVNEKETYNLKIAYQQHVMFEAEYQDLELGYAEMNEYIKNLG